MAPSPPAVPLFPPKPNINLITDKKLQDALSQVTKGLSRKAYGLTIVDTGKAAAGASDFPSAGVNDDVEHYSGSMLKVACMYAAFSLLDLARRFNDARQPKDADTLFRMFHDELDPRISSCCPLINGGAGGARMPKWRDVFDVSGDAGTLAVNFDRGYYHSMSQMIIPSDNGEAGKSIRGVGYCYLNGLMADHGFFDSKSKSGVWLAGDYGSAAVVTIPCDNDGTTKQGTTSAAMARLALAIFTGRVLPGRFHVDMLRLLRASAHGSDRSYFTRTDIMPDPLNFEQVTHGKIGRGDLNPISAKHHVYSDINAINNPYGLSGDYTVCYTNVDYKLSILPDVLQVFRDTISIYNGIPVKSPAAANPPATTAPSATAPSATAPSATAP